VIADSFGAQGKARLIEGDAAGRRGRRAAIAYEMRGILDGPGATAITAAPQQRINALGRLGLTEGVMTTALVEPALLETDQDFPPAVKGPSAIIGRPAVKHAGLAGDNVMLHASLHAG